MMETLSVKLAVIMMSSVKLAVIIMSSVQLILSIIFIQCFLFDILML